MQQDKLISICNHFIDAEKIQGIEPITSGHINDTYLVSCRNDDKFVLQKLNTSVFTNYDDVIKNKLVVSSHLNTFYKNTDSTYKTIQFLKTKSGTFYTQADKEIWMLMTYITNSQVFDKAPNSNLVFEAGKLYGNFINGTKTLDSSKISEILPNFHSVPWRLKQFDETLKHAKSNRIEDSRNWIKLVNKYRNAMSKLWKLKEENILPLRITHNDTKLSNILFSKSEPLKGLAVIDLDTVMPGLTHFDFGDSVRSICSNTIEDDSNLDNVFIKLDYYEAFTKGFAKETKHILNQTEIQYLPLGAQNLIFIIGLRFLTDYLNNDTYYKTAYENHNLVRASNQFTLFNSLLNHIEEIKSITNKVFDLHNIS